MNSLQINGILKRCKIRNYIGVFPSDLLPEGAKGLMVVNLDHSRKPGSHWVCLYIDKNKGEYFDTFGRPPSGKILNYLNKNCKRWIDNKYSIQSVVSSYCGHYCILYCIMRSKGTDVHKFVKLFSKTDTGLNDKIVCEMIGAINKKIKK